MGFLNRIHRHLTNTASLSSFPRGVSFERERKLDATTDLLFLPDKATSQSYVQCFFDHASVTYRYLDRRTIDDLLNRFYEPESQSSKDERGLVLLLVLSLGCVKLSVKPRRTPTSKLRLIPYRQRRKQLPVVFQYERRGSQNLRATSVRMTEVFKRGVATDMSLIQCALIQSSSKPSR